MDAEPEMIVWDHWELSATGPLSVFRYTVPKERSHFAVDLSDDHHPDYPAYHGEIVMNPTTGEIFRITVIANTRDPRSAYSSYVSVEFGPTEIGGVTYVCPIRGIAMTKAFDSFADQNAEPPPIAAQISINDVSFTKYHVFRSNSRVISGSPNP
jgi:hypothetical protein